MFKNGVKHLFFSDLIIKSSKTEKIAYVGILTALSIVSNMFLEFKMFDVQFSITIFIAFLIGALLGSVLGFCSLFLGDLIGFFVNSGGAQYMPWVGLSTGLIAFIAGLIINGIQINKKCGIYIKIAIVIFLSFLICTVGVNTAGFYIYYYKLGFSTKVMEYVTEYFGGNVNFFAYLMYRLIFKLQLINSVFNYALCFGLIPVILKIKIFNKTEKSH